MMIFGHNPKKIKIGKFIFNLIWKILAKFCLFLETIIEVVIYILAKIKDGIYFIRDWLEERELLS